MPSLHRTTGLALSTVLVCAALFYLTRASAFSSNDGIERRIPCTHHLQPTVRRCTPEIAVATKDETVRLDTGNAFDMTGERTRTEYRSDYSARWLDESFEIKVRNHKSEAAEVPFVETSVPLDELGYSQKFRPLQDA